MADKIEKPNTDEIASIEKDIFHDYFGKIITNPDKIIKSESGGKGIELYEDLLYDAEVGASLQSRKLAVTSKEWELLPASDKPDDIKVADYTKKVFKEINQLDSYRQASLTGVVLGYKPCEIRWDISEGDVWIKEIIPRASHRFVFDKNRKLRLLTLTNMIEGEEIPERNFQIFINPSDNGSPYGDGLGRLLYWPAWFKKNGIKHWLTSSDKYGSPTAIGKYPCGTSKEQQNILLETLDAIQKESGIIIPDNMLIELLESSRTGTINTHKELCEFMDQYIRKVILGHSAASESTPGKLGNEGMAIEVREEYTKADADLLCGYENSQLIKYIVDYNFPNIKKYPKVWIRTQGEKDLKPLADRDKIIFGDLGVPVTRQYFYDTYNIPAPQNGEELVVIPQKNINQGSPASFAEKLEESKYPDQQAIDEAINSITPDEMQSQMEGVLKPIIDMLQNGDNYNSIMEQLVKAFPNMDTDQVEKMIERAIFVSEIWGRLYAKTNS